ncbi:GH22414 [Drosophila grimshawi]|uniref:GH22414 n=1 Tax=Drosophila grimshawi TaxID=7222 RepID=B4JZ38_DROGR|nr:GH22414 [Drosophila grimshawi]
MITGGDHGPQTRSRGPRKDDSIWSESEGQEPAPPTLPFTAAVLSRTPVRSTDEVQAEVLDLPLGLCSAEKSAVNAALAQAHATYRQSLSPGIGGAIRDEIRAGM